jgi:Cu-Zn family superoxide dismutase
MKKLLYLSIILSNITYAIQLKVISTTTHLQIGTVELQDSEWGLLIYPNIATLTPGVHGFHVHSNPTCDDEITHNKTILAGLAGGHFDPQQTKLHLGPYKSTGHLGDLPVLIVSANSKATTPILAPRLKLEMLKNRSLIIHESSDNYADQPIKLGGGGNRVACSIIK